MIMIISTARLSLGQKIQFPVRGKFPVEEREWINASIRIIWLKDAVYLCIDK